MKNNPVKRSAYLIIANATPYHINKQKVGLSCIKFFVYWRICALKPRQGSSTGKRHLAKLCLLMTSGTAVKSLGNVDVMETRDFTRLEFKMIFDAKFLQSPVHLENYFFLSIFISTEAFLSRCRKRTQNVVWFLHHVHINVVVTIDHSYLPCPYPEPVYTGWSSVNWNATEMPLVDPVYTGIPLEKLSWNSPTLECHWINLVESAPHWDATGETLFFSAYTGTPLEGLWQPTHAPTHIVKHAE